MKYLCSRCGREFESESSPSYAIDMRFRKDFGDCKVLDERYTCPACSDVEASEGEWIKCGIDTSQLRTYVLTTDGCYEV